MHYRNAAAVLLYLMISICFLSCKDGDQCKAGAGGNLNVVFSPKHHTMLITGCTVKIKYNAKEFPGADGIYEISAQAEPGVNAVTVSGLKCGDYYIYGTGTDSSLSGTDKTVRGGIPFSTAQESGTIYIDIPVTEAGH
jgi:hypothetical protein